MPPNLRSTAVYLYEATSLCVRSFLRCQVVLRCTKHHSRGSGQYTSSGQTPQQSTAYGDDALRTLLKDRHTRVHAASQRMLAKGHEGHWRHQFKGRGAPPRSPAPHKKKLAEVEAERGGASFGAARDVHTGVQTARRRTDIISETRSCQGIKP